MNELFEIPESLSPKLKWLKKHSLRTHHDPEMEDCPESPETGKTIFPWVCVLAGKTYHANSTNYGEGRTEDEAIADYCQKTGTPHYTLTDA